MTSATNRLRPTVLDVRLNQTRVGTITNLPYDRNLFVFDEQYANDPNRPTLSLSFYDENSDLITEPEQVQTKVPPFFSNLLPEGRLREYVAELAGIKDVREFYLLWLLGADLPGAVVVEEAGGQPIPPADDNASSKTKRRSGRVLRFSLAGVQLKFSAVGNPQKQLTIPAEGRDGSWIVKLPSPRYPLVPENEYSMMKLAEAVGIEVAEVGLIPTKDIEGIPKEFGEEKANSLYVRRFDRTPDGGRIHMEDFNQIYRQFPHDKYKNYSYTNIAGDIFTFLGEGALVEFIRRLIFNAAIGNADMHLKNWSVLYPDGRKPGLAPGYDFVSTIRYIDDRSLALSIARQKDTGKLNEELLVKFADRARVPKSLVLTTALETAERLVREWRRLQKHLPLDKKSREGVEGQLGFVPLTRKVFEK